MSFNKFLIKGGLVVSAGKSSVQDVLVCDGKIAQIAPSIEADSNTEIYDATDCVVTYGLADVHTHLREPGYSYKETIASGTAAAARGGVTTVCSMPNLNPAPDNVVSLGIQQSLIEQQAVVEVRPYATITRNREGKEIVDFELLAPHCVAFTDDGSGVQDPIVMESAMRKIAEVGGILAAHCEEESMLCGGYIHAGDYAALHGHKGIPSCSESEPFIRDMKLVEQTGCRYHICHISAFETVKALALAKKLGLPITGETTPHYLTITDMDLQEDGRFKMNPPIRSAADREALITAINSGVIEVIATDHAPHSAEEKGKGLAGSAMGVVGLETSFAVIYTRLVREGLLTLEKAIELMCDNPRRIFNLGGGMEVGQRADIAIFNTKTPFFVNSEEFLSMGKATPFEGWMLFGRCMLTLFGGKVVWKENNSIYNL